jgi:hypothetical protein
MRCLKPGRSHQFEQHRRALADAYAAAEIEEPAWVYEVYSGGPTESFQIWTAYRHIGQGSYGDISQLDLVPENRRRIEHALGAEGCALVADTAAASIRDSETTLFTVDPRSSYPPPEFALADPTFWNSGTPSWP